jgi:DNA (cytosine-5)-methyltransferase 3A
MQAMNVLSLFDGCSGGQQALEMSNIKVDNYFACEIDKYAIKVTQANYPKTVQLGDVRNVSSKDLPKIDLLIGGSPCQSFSFAGKRNGMTTKDSIEIHSLSHYLELKSQNFEFEGQSYLFWEYMRILNEVKPKYFLIENVEMGEKWEKVLSKAIGVNGIHINSALLTAQNRKRIYWINIGLEPKGLFGDLESVIQQPKDRKVLLKDILQDEVDEKYFLSDKIIAGFEKHALRHLEKKTGFAWNPNDGSRKGSCLRANASIAPTDNILIVHNTMPRSSTTGKGGTGHLSRNDGKTYCLDTGNTNAVEIKCIAMRGRGENNEQKLEPRSDYKTNCLTSVLKDNLIKAGDYRTDEGFRWNKEGKSPTLMARAREDTSGPPLINTPSIRRLTPIECERLQGMKDNYTNYVSDSQRYKMIGNGWTIPVISHLFNYIK